MNNLLIVWVWNTSGIVIIIAIILLIILIPFSIYLSLQKGKKIKTSLLDEAKLNLRNYIKTENNYQNTKLIFVRIERRIDNDYKGRIGFATIVHICDNKTNKIKKIGAYELEKITKKNLKNKFENKWLITEESDVAKINKIIDIAEHKLTLSKKEKKLNKKNFKQFLKNEKKVQKNYKNKNTDIDIKKYKGK